LLRREAVTFDATNNHYICPQGKILKHRTARTENRIIPTGPRRAIARHVASGHNVPGGRNVLHLYISMRTLVSTAIALQNTEAYRHSRRLRKKVEILFA